MNADHSQLASRVGHLRFTFSGTSAPYVLLEATRPSVVGSEDTSNLTYPFGTVSIDPSRQEIMGSNPERQDFIIGPNAAPSFRGYFCARFDAPFTTWGTATNGTLHVGETSSNGTMLSGYVAFTPDTHVVNVRVGVSFIPVDQARKNLDTEIPDTTTLEQTAKKTRTEWAEKLDRISVEGGSEDDLTVLYTAVFHSLQVLSMFCGLNMIWLTPYSIHTSKVRMRSTILDMMTPSMKDNPTPGTRFG